MDYSKHISTAAVIFLILNLLSPSILGSSCNSCGQRKLTHNPHVHPKSHMTQSLTESKKLVGSCPKNALQLGVCAKVLKGPVNAVIGNSPVLPCCSVIAGLLDLEAAACLCTAIKANVLGININIPIALGLLINACGKQLPSDFICA